MIWTEYRAVFHRPASILDDPEARDHGYVVGKTRPFKTKEEARAKALERSEESHAHVVGYESREVMATDWEPA